MPKKTVSFKLERGRNEEEELATRRTELDRQRNWLDVSKQESTPWAAETRPWVQCLLADPRSASKSRTDGELHEIEAPPELGDGRLLHMDLHPENVMLSPAGPVVIDWTNARRDPALDAAMTSDDKSRKSGG